MVYNARTQRGLLGFLLVLTLLSTWRKYFSGGLLYFEILFTVFLVIGIFTKFRLKIDAGSLTYQILCLTIPIYQKVIYPHQIAQVKFKRVGWATKGAILQVKKGFNIRIVNFTPNNMFEDLVYFANEYGVSISKTKDYLLLEKGF